MSKILLLCSDKVSRLFENDYLLPSEGSPKVPYFEFIGEDKERGVEHSTKYWEINQVGKKLTIRYGKIGTDGQLTVKEFESKEDAEVELNKLIKSKTKKGYVEKPNPHS